jgi:hypothetical protein
VLGGTPKLTMHHTLHGIWRTKSDSSNWQAEEMSSSGFQLIVVSRQTKKQTQEPRMQSIMGNTVFTSIIGHESLLERCTQK